jgi:hypothetical protein
MTMIWIHLLCRTPAIMKKTRNDATRWYCPKCEKFLNTNDLAWKFEGEE